LLAHTYHDSNNSNTSARTEIYTQIYRILYIIIIRPWSHSRPFSVVVTISLELLDSPFKRHLSRLPYNKSVYNALYRYIGRYCIIYNLLVACCIHKIINRLMTSPCFFFFTSRGLVLNSHKKVLLVTVLLQFSGVYLTGFFVFKFITLDFSVVHYINIIDVWHHVSGSFSMPTRVVIINTQYAHIRWIVFDFHLEWFVCIEMLLKMSIRVRYASARYHIISYHNNISPVLHTTTSIPRLLFFLKQI